MAIATNTTHIGFRIATPALFGETLILSCETESQCNEWKAALKSVLDYHLSIDSDDENDKSDRNEDVKVKVYTAFEAALHTVVHN